MIYLNKYHILPTVTFKEELEEIIYYVKRKLKEPLVAKRFYNDVIKEINSLAFMPDRCKQIEGMHDETRILRKTSVNNYIIIYEVNNNTRTSLYFTYIS
ncbi:MAG: type II toxin-antitoxin system RelE/ParE family toxin [Clostridia bacterium]|nr:type II toxin-antitoxin system RelE/ParE family toxin [Clostridia bacterium]